MRLGAALLVGTLAAPLVVLSVWRSARVIVLAVARRGPASIGTAEPSQPDRGPVVDAPVAVLYLTCDDFQASACESLLAQRGVPVHLFVLDDSTLDAMRREVDAWAHRQRERVHIVRRPDRRGFKAGNVNHWLRMYGDSYPYTLLADADSHLPAEGVADLVATLETSPSRTFAQAAHRARTPPETSFQRLLDLHVAGAWRSEIQAARLFGVPAMLGHGVLLRTASLQAIGGLPDFVSEDIAFTILKAEKGLTGLVAPNMTATEDFPRDYRTYWRRLCRWSFADADVARRLLARLLASPVPLPARIDLALRELRLPVAVLLWPLLVSVGLSALIGADGQATGPEAWSVLPALLLPLLPSLQATDRPLVDRVVYVLVAPFVAAATACVPLIHGVRGLRRRKPHFDPTGAGTATIRPWPSIFEALTGASAVLAGVITGHWSLTAAGIAIASSPCMRTPLQLPALATGTIAFWTLLLLQVATDTQTGELPMSHVVVLLTIPLLL